MSKDKRPPPNWMTIGAGALAIGGRPGKRSYPGLERSNCSAILSLLVDEEGALRLRDEALERGWFWHWLPLRGASPPAARHDVEYREKLEAMLERIRGGQRVCERHDVTADLTPLLCARRSKS